MCQACASCLGRQEAWPDCQISQIVPGVTLPDYIKLYQNVLNCLNGEDTFVADLLADAEAEFSALEEAEAVLMA